MKEGTLQSSTARYFDGGSFRFAETGAGLKALSILEREVFPRYCLWI
jgi:hypothetical protein